MPFLCVLPKAHGPAPVRPVADSGRLAALLCPYAGEIRRVSLAPHGELFVSSLSADGDGSSRVALIPNHTRKSPQTAWLEITREAHGLRLETDPLGTFPLWCFENDRLLVITSEVKALLALEGVRVALTPGDPSDRRKRPPTYSPHANVRRLTPGAIVRVSDSLEVTEEQRHPLVYRPGGFDLDDEAAAALDRALVESARSIDTGDGAPWATFLSGGIDSSMATALTARKRRGLRTFTLGTAHGNEYADAEDLATALELSHTRVHASESDAVRHFDRAVFCNETVDGLTAETIAQLGILAEVAHAHGVRHVVTGYGADLLFGSMLRHELYMKLTGVDDLQSLIERTAWSGEFSPFYAWSLGVDVHHLFWSPEVMNSAFRVRPEASFDGVREKVLLRNLAVARGYVASAHAFRKKQAMTDGTQFNRLLSAALGLDGPHAYEAKSSACITRLQKVFGPEETKS